jgi:DNA invertase Pin-like site-specific DNA recombinase
VFRETDSPIANLMLSAMAAFTEFERDRSGSPP